MYVNEQTGKEMQVYINCIKGCWKHAKQHFFKLNGTSLSNFESYLAAIIWHNWHWVNLYEFFCEL